MTSINKTKEETHPLIQDTNIKEITASEIVNFFGLDCRYLTILLIFSGCLFSGEACIVMMLSMLMPEIEKEWNLTSFESGLIGSVLFIGIVIGGLVFGFISDRHGRKTALFVTVINITVFNVLSAFSFNYIIFITLRFITGFGVGGSCVAFTYFSETVPTKIRGVGLLLLELFWCASSIYEGGVGWLLFSRDVKYSMSIYCLLSGLPVFIVIFMFPFVDESLRYYSVSGEDEKIRRVIRRLERRTGKKLGEFKVVISGEDEGRKGNVRELFCLNFKLTLTFLNLVLFMVAGSLVYYGSVLSMTDFVVSENKYLIVFFSSFSEIPGVIIPSLFLPCFGRKTIMGICFLGTGIFLVLLIFEISSSIWYELMVIFLVRGFIMAASSMTWVIAQESLPTNVRSVGAGIAYSVAKTTNIITPIITKLIPFDNELIPKIVFAIFAFAATISSFIHPIETKGRELQDYGNDDKED